MQFDLLLATVAVVVILGLAFYAGALMHRIKAHKTLNLKREEQKQAETALKKQQRNNDICESIRCIARATAQKQCNVSEAAIRLTVLLETLLLEQAIDTEKDYPALSEMFSKVKEMPTHEQRKTVPLKALKKLDRQRQVFEAQLEHKIIAEAAQLENFSLYNQ